jgi:hypothetical protein
MTIVRTACIAPSNTLRLGALSLKWRHSEQGYPLSVPIRQNKVGELVLNFGVLVFSEAEEIEATVSGEAVLGGGSPHRESTQLF